MSNSSVASDCLRQGTIRDQIYATHPVVQDRVRIVTKSVEETAEIASSAILHRRLGSYFMAEPRVGKTTTIEVLKAVLPQRFPGLPIFDIIAKRHNTFTEKNFFGELLSDFQFSNAMHGTAAERRLRCFSFLLSFCRTTQSNRLLLLIDEGQNWGELELELLRDLANDLRKNEITCITLIFAHPNIETIVKNNLLRKGRTDLTARFLMTPYQFEGIEKMLDLRQVFGAFDSAERHQYPPGSGLCFSEFFFPLAFQDGWRLAGETSNAWTSFTSVAGHKKFPRSKIGMNLVMGAIRFFLLLSENSPDSHPSSENWNDAVAASRY